MALLFAACSSASLTEADPLPALDEPYFRCRVQPVLTKNCSQLVCHGDEGRYYNVYARNRLRLQGGEAERNDFMSLEERAANFAATRSFVDVAEPEASYLLVKSLDQEAGGFYHGGATEFEKGDVFLTVDDFDYQVLLSWIQGQTEDPACEEPGSNL